MKPEEIGYKKYLVEDHVDTPVKILGIEQVDEIYSKGHFSYARKDTMLYSWGSGDNFVLGNMDEMAEHTPYEVDDFDFIRSELRGDVVANTLLNTK